MDGKEKVNRPNGSVKRRGQGAPAAHHEESAANQDPKKSEVRYPWIHLAPRRKFWCYLCGRHFRWKCRLAFHICDLGRLGPKQKEKWAE